MKGRQQKEKRVKNYIKKKKFHNLCTHANGKTEK